MQRSFLKRKPSHGIFEALSLLAYLTLPSGGLLLFVLLFGHGVAGQSPSPFDFQALLAANRAQAARFEKVEADHRELWYKNAWGQWLANAPIRAALNLAPDPEPDPPLRYSVKFDEANWRFVVADGPERYERLEPPAPPKPAVGDSLPGLVWDANRRFLRAGDSSPAGFQATFEGAKWIRVDQPGPFGVSRFWQKQ